VRERERERELRHQVKRHHFAGFPSKSGGLSLGKNSTFLYCSTIIYDFRFQIIKDAIFS